MVLVETSLTADEKRWGHTPSAILVIKNGAGWRFKSVDEGHGNQSLHHDRPPVRTRAKPDEGARRRNYQQHESSNCHAGVLAFVGVRLAAQDTAVASTTSGSVRGTTLTAGGAVFKGIPFSQPPVGDLQRAIDFFALR